MWSVLTISYLTLGLVSAGFTLAIFQPQPGFRPPALLWVLAIVAYVLLWPFLWMIGIGYWIGAICSAVQRSREHAAPRAPRRARFLYRSLYEETPN